MVGKRNRIFYVEQALDSNFVRDGQITSKKTLNPDKTARYISHFIHHFHQV